jgi:uncharacterized protein (DUF983 family)
MFRAFLKANDQCDVCGEELFHHRADDFPAYVVIFIVGYLLVPAVLYVEIHFAPPYWMDVALWLPMTLILTIGLRQPTKGAIVVLQWNMGMHGFERSKRAWELAHSDAAPTHVVRDHGRLGALGIRKRADQWSSRSHSEGRMQ